MNCSNISRTALVAALAIGLGACSGGLFGGGDGKNSNGGGGVKGSVASLGSQAAAISQRSMHSLHWRRNLAAAPT